MTQTGARRPRRFWGQFQTRHMKWDIYINLQCHRRAAAEDGLMRRSEKWSLGCRRRRNEALKRQDVSADSSPSAASASQGRAALILKITLRILLICCRVPRMSPLRQRRHVGGKFQLPAGNQPEPGGLITDQLVFIPFSLINLWCSVWTWSRFKWSVWRRMDSVFVVLDVSSAESAA